MSPREVFADPVTLPEGVHHGGFQAYNVYKCRCRYCVIFRRLYDRAKDARRQANVVKRRDGARDYLAHRGIQVYGPGPFRKNPLKLARIVAEFFNDDIELWIDRKDKPS